MKQNYNWTLPKPILERLGKTHYGKQRIIAEGDDMLMILHKPPGPKDTDRDEVLFWRNAKGKWLCNGRENGGFFINELLKEYQQQFDELDRLYNEAQTADHFFVLVERIAPISRAMNNLSNALQAARNNAKQDKALIEMRDEAYELQRNFELLLSDSKIGMEYRIAKNAEEQAKASREAVQAQHRLNVLAAIFFPLTAITTVFGMNLNSGLENKGPLVFWTIFFIGLFIGIALKRWVIPKKQKPLSPTQGSHQNRL